MLAVLAVLGGFGTAGVALVGLLLRTLSGAPVPRWQASQYWLDYTGGFVRRGLPGQLLSTLAGGVPGYGAMAAAAGVVAVVAIAAVVVLVVLVARAAPDRSARWAVAGILLISPLTVSLVAWDIGRYDGIGVGVLSGLAVWGRSGAPRTRWPGLLLLSGAFAAAAASEEFLVAYLLPVAALAVAARFDREGRAGVLAVLAGPALVVAVAGALVPPSRPVVDAAIRHAQRAGVEITDRPGTNALAAQLQTPADAVALAARVSVGTHLLCVAVFAGFLLAAVWAVRRWTGAGGPRHRLVVAGYCLLAAATGLVGVDYRRWWGLALLALLACAALAGPDPARARPPGRTGCALVGLAAVLSFAGQLLPVHPSWDPAFGGIPAPLWVVVQLLLG